ncbi:DUF3828 domain-containing protein [Longimicrobium sp.]|uniref:DUF3828 domain-containing protein n=1 Tax=Longimicrobium sp. TaxID=2029185 RepID=UPI002BB9E76E|nr:DUF3828 domain-containing protein [Longimicrobium sp.]HSU17207.1 DUF3828 domain-containing protein [Longimicrobium sp.]
MNPHAHIRRRASRRLSITASLLALAVAAQACGAGANAAPPDPTAVVTTLYRDHFAHEQNWDRTYKRQRALFAPDLAALIDADIRAAEANADEIVGLDFDPLTNAQDEMTAFQVGPATRGGASATVGVVVRQDSARTNLRVRLARSDAGWRVTNIHYPEGDLVSILRQLAAGRAPKP